MVALDEVDQTMTTATVELITASVVDVQPHLTLARRGADDTEIEILDVVDGADEHAVDDLVDLHGDLFPGYEFVAAEIAADAGAPHERASRVLDTLAAELAEHAPTAAPIGAFGESTDRLVRRWLGAGFRGVDVPYAEPVAGRHWRAREDSSMRPMNLLWLPMRGAEDPSGAPQRAGAAAFLIDHYALPLDHPTVIAATGDQRTRPGAHR